MTISAAVQSISGQKLQSEPISGVDVVGLSRQIVLVLCENWDSTNGWLRRFDLEESDWKLSAPPTRVSLGRNGLAWGRGVQPPQEGLQKKEGDGRSPAGIFPLPYVFGKASLDEVKGIRVPYVQCTASLECVDDTNSTYYNQIIDRTSVSDPDWHSSEKMLTVSDEYRLGVVVEQNIPPHAGAGSCVFLHVWGAKLKTTSGCTAMPLGELEALVAWMDHSALPILVQLPHAEYVRCKGPWRLPEIPSSSP